MAGFSFPLVLLLCQNAEVDLQSWVRFLYATVCLTISKLIGVIVLTREVVRVRYDDNGVLWSLFAL